MSQILHKDILIVKKVFTAYLKFKVNCASWCPKCPPMFRLLRACTPGKVTLQLQFDHMAQAISNI